MLIYNEINQIDNQIQNKIRENEAQYKQINLFFKNRPKSNNSYYRIYVEPWQKRFKRTLHY